MSQVRELAKLIPNEYRKEILELDMINEAVAQHGNPTMQYLGIIWKNYIEPTFEPNCNLCYSRVLNNLKGMLNDLIELEKESKMLEQL